MPACQSGVNSTKWTAVSGDRVQIMCRIMIARPARQLARSRRALHRTSRALLSPRLVLDRHTSTIIAHRRHTDNNMVNRVPA